MKPFGNIGGNIIGKCLGDRFENLKITWNQPETEIHWEISDYRTTYGNTNSPYGDGNPVPPLMGVIKLN